MIVLTTRIYVDECGQQPSTQAPRQTSNSLLTTDLNGTAALEGVSLADFYA